VVDEERMRPGHWLGSVLWQLVEWQEGHPTHKNPVLFIHKGSVLEQVAEENRGRTSWPMSTWEMTVKTSFRCFLLVTKTYTVCVLCSHCMFCVFV